MRPGATPSPRDAGGEDRALSEDGRIVLIHGWAPPTRGGTAFVVELVLSCWDSRALDVWTRVSQRRAVRRGPFVLPGRYRYFPKLRSIPRGPRSLSWAITAANLALAMPSGLVVGCLARRDGARCIVSVVDEGFSQIAGGVAARVAGRPHVIWVFDLWEENAYAGSDRSVARWLERRLWRSAAAIVVHAEELSQHYRAKHGVGGHVLRTPISESSIARARVGARPGCDRDEWEVLVAGSVYWAQAEALHRVAAAVRQVDGVSLTVLGDPRLQTERIDADRYEPAVSGDALRARLQQARLLVLGLSFDAAHPEVVETATPARLPEYLASGVPVLVHAPARSHVARHVRRRDLATVIDVPDVDAVAAAIRAIKDDGATSVRRAERAREFAARQHSAGTVRQEFRELIEALPEHRLRRVPRPA